MPVTVSVKNGTKTVYNVQVVDAEALATGKALKMYRVTKGGKMAELAADLYTINKDGSFTVKGQKNHTYRIQ